MTILSDEFYYQHIRIDSINARVYADLLAKEGDVNGRGLLVTLTENGVMKDTTGVALNLKWEHTSVGNQGLNNFEAVDLSKGLYKLTYPSEMLNRGTVRASIQIIDSGKLAGIRNIKITVDRGVGDDTAIVSSDSFTALAQALIDVNNLESTYAPRLLSTEQQLAQKAEQGDLTVEKSRIDNLVANAGNTDNNAELLDVRVDNYGVVYDTAGTAVRNIQKEIPKGVNLFSGDFKDNLIIDIEGTIIEPPSNAEGVLFGIVPIKENETYTITKLLGGNRFVVALINDFPTSENIPMETSYVHRAPNSESFQSHTVTNTFNAKFLVFLVGYNHTTIPEVQVEKGKVYSGFRPYGKLDYESTFLRKSKKNLFNNVYIPAIIGKTSVNSFFTSNETYAEAKTAVVPIEPNETYTITIPDEDNDRLRVVTHDVFPMFHNTASNVPDTYNAKTEIYDSVSSGIEHSLTFTNNGTDKYLIIYLSTPNSNVEPRLQVEKNSIATPFEPPEWVSETYLPLSALQPPIKKQNYLFGTFNEYYVSPPEESVGLGQAFELENSTIEDIYSLYDQLAADNPTMVEKRLLGYGGDTSNVEDTSLPIYEYHFKTPKGQTAGSGIPVESPTVLIQTGLHGDEKSSVWSLARFMTQLMNNWVSQKNLEAIRTNVDIKVIPIVNPGGFNANTRRNLNNVDLNRNFSYLWDETVVTTQPKGDAPYSELETQIVRDWITENNNALAFVDYHNAFNPGHSGYLSTSNEQLWEIYSSLARQWTVRWNEKYGLSRNVSEDTVQMYITNDQLPMAFHEAINKGIKYSAVLEVSKFFEVTLARENEYSSEVIERGTEIIANYLLAILDGYVKGFLK